MNKKKKTIELSIGSYITGEDVEGYDTIEELLANTCWIDMEESHHKSGSSFIVPFINYLKIKHDDYCESTQEGGSHIGIFFEDDDAGFLKMVDLIEKKFAKHLKSKLLKMDLYEGFRVLTVNELKELKDE